MQLTVVIPAYNERDTILEILRRVQATPFDKEIVVVDDGSTDGTREILRAVDEPNVRVIFHEQNQGKGGAVRTGFAAARGEFVIVQDADLEYDPRDYQALLGPLIDGSADAVFGSRFDGNPRKVNNYWHAVGNKILTHLSNMTTNLDLNDLEGGLKAYRRDLVQSIPLESRGFEVEPELVAKIARSRARVYEVPISYHGRSYAEGKKIGWRDGVRAIATILKYGPLAGGQGGEPIPTNARKAEVLDKESAWLWEHLRGYVGERVLAVGGAAHQLVDRQGLTHVVVEPSDLLSGEWAAPDGERFDTVLLADRLDQPPDRRVLRGFIDALHPGGRVVLLMPVQQRPYSRARLARLLRDAGFAVEHLRFLSPSAAAWWFLKSRLLRHGERADPPMRLSLLAVGRKK